jgi:hypothetical protein
MNLLAPDFIVAVMRTVPVALGAMKAKWPLREDLPIVTGMDAVIGGKKTDRNDLILVGGAI